MTYTKPTLVGANASSELIRGQANTNKTGSGCFDTSSNHNGSSTGAYEVDE